MTTEKKMHNLLKNDIIEKEYGFLISSTKLNCGRQEQGNSMVFEQLMLWEIKLD